MVTIIGVDIGGTFTELSLYDGVKVVAHGEVLTLDYEGSGKKLQGVLQNIEQTAPQTDWKK